MALEVYRRKRKFDVTPEPRGGVAKVRGKDTGLRFVVQKHAARRLHYDFRLELDGVMKSWAVTRGPSLVPGEKRLAVHVEDHPIEYNTFEGTIPQGEYGGGTVMIWDRGRWSPEGDVHRAYAKGHLDFSLEGEKLSGRWHLVRMNKRRGETKEPWLLIKARDDAARAPGDPDILEDQPLSVASGRSLDEIAEGKGRKRVWHSNRSVADNVKAAAAVPPPKGEGGSRRLPGGDHARGLRTTPHPNPPPQGGRGHTERVASTSRTSPTLGSRRHKGDGSAPHRPQAPLPDFVPPSLATLRAEAPSGQGWVHEIKFDGYRMQARLDRGKVRLLTRKGLDWTEKFPNVAAAVARLPARSALIDGEVVVEDDHGISSFSALQAALKAHAEDAFAYYVFDLLYLDGRDLCELPLTERKAALERLVGKSQRGTIRLSEHLSDAGEKVLEHACAMGLEGIVSKRSDTPYRSGRTDAFIKTKCANDQELVVGGFSPSTALANAIGALVVGYYDNGRLVYAGRVGTGYTRVVARDLWKRLHAIERDKPPFDAIPREEAHRRDVRWVEPQTVIETELRGWTADGLVRQAAFKGVREDKPAREVVREVPAATRDEADGDRSAGNGRNIPPPQGEGGRRRRPGGAPARQARASGNPHPIAAAARRQSTSPIQGEVLQSPLLRRRAHAANSGSTASARSQPEDTRAGSVRFTHPERVYWPDVGVTKRELADYYASVWRFMAPLVVDRPLALVRCPDGTAGECFFQKHASAGLSEQYLKTVIDKNKRQIIAVEDLDGLLSLVQAGVLEVHVRGSRIDRLDLCDRIVFDLDPGPGIEWREVVAAARDVRERLAGLDLTSFVKLTGGKGLHVVLPIAGVDWESTKEFAQALAMAMAADEPERYVVKITSSLRTKKILVDYFRNSLEQTSVAAYSTRAREGAPVSVPVTWDELPRTRAGNQYTVRNLGKRLAGLKADPWEDLPRVKQTLPDLRKLARR